MLQFFFAMVMTINAIHIGCDFPMWMQYTLVAYMVSFLILFGKFFVKEYKSSKQTRPQRLIAEGGDGVANGQSPKKLL